MILLVASVVNVGGSLANLDTDPLYNVLLSQQTLSNSALGKLDECILSEWCRNVNICYLETRYSFINLILWLISFLYLPGQKSQNDLLNLPLIDSQ